MPLANGRPCVVRTQDRGDHGSPSTDWGNAHGEIRSWALAMDQRHVFTVYNEWPCGVVPWSMARIYAMASLWKVYKVLATVHLFGAA